MSGGTPTDFSVTTVTLTPAVDVGITLPTLTPGTLHRLQTVRQDAGGKGINVSKALQAFAIPTCATGLLGGARGKWIEESLNQLAIPTAFVHIAEETRMNVKVAESDGRLTEFNSLSPAGTADKWAMLEENVRQVQANHWLALCGRLPEGMDPKWYQRAILRVKQNGVKTLLDSSGDGLKYGIEAQPDVVKPNEDELSHWIGRNLQTRDDVIAAAQQMVAMGVKIVLVSRGKQGMLAVTKSTVHEVTVPQVEALSSVGAGDTLVAGLFYGLYHGYSFTDTLQFAAAAGTAAAATPGTQQPPLDAVKRLVPSVAVTAESNH